MDDSVQHLADTIEASRSRALGENGGYKGGEENLRSGESVSFEAASKWEFILVNFFILTQCTNVERNSRPKFR